MKKIDWTRKLTSRKFWLSIASFVAMLLVALSRAYRDAIADYKQFFHVIEFAVYCREDETENYDAFSAGIT